MATEQTPPPSTDEVDDEHHDYDHDDNESHDGDAHGDSKSNAPIQKRRRVTRACDTCRGKKIKCDGKQPCTHCTVYSYECTYDQPSNRRRNPAPQYIEALENRLARAEALLKTVMPNVDLNDPELGNGMLPPLVQFPPQMPRKGAQGNEEDKGSMLQSMIEGTGSMDLDQDGRLDFYGSSSGRVFYERISRQMGTFDGVWNSQNGWNDYGRSDNLFREKKRPFDSPRSADSPGDADAVQINDLPSKEIGRALCECALDDAMCLLRFMHQPSFWTMFDRIYDTAPSHWSTAEHKYLPVVYAAMALGSLFAKTEDSKLGKEGYESAFDGGYKYFKAAQSMMELTDIRDLQSLQAAALLTYFIQSSAKLSTCYSYVGVCLFGALRMGMHRDCTGQFNCLENEMRKRCFWLIRKMDVFVAGTLGMPILLSSDDIDQVYPAEVDDELITPEAILPQPEGKVALIAAANVHSRLLVIWEHLLRTIYPTKVQSSGNNPSGVGRVSHAPSISYAKIRDIERSLQEWMDTIPMGLRPGSGGDKDTIRLQHMLRMSYAHVQMVLYRPFLHYMTKKCQQANTDQRFYACAAACVHVARNSIHIMSEMNRRHFLIGAYWFQMYTTFWAVLILVFYSMENQNDKSTLEYFNTAIDGKEMLATMAKRSAAADRCNIILQQVFSKLPDRFQRGRQNSSSSSSADNRKRHAQSSQRSDLDSRPASNPRSGGRAASNQFGLPRSSTMPHHQHTLSGNHKRSSLSNVAFGPPQHTNTEPYRSHNPYTPSGSSDQMTPHSGASPDVPSSPGSTINFGQHPQAQDVNTAGGYGLNPAVHDLASMIFPSNDPFAYPNQPMTTFESQYGPTMDSLDAAGDASATFDLNGELAQTKMEPGTIGEFMQSMQDPSRQPIGPSVPEEMMSGAWLGGSAGASIGGMGGDQPTAGNQGQNMNGASNGGTGMDGAGLDYQSFFSGGDLGLPNMNGNLWFQGGIM